MPMNPNLINHGIDDDEYADACPTLGTLVLAHFSTPHQHNPILYGVDGQFFATYPSRRIYIRPALRGEFDPFTSEEDFQERPKLWVMVSQVAPDHHMIVPVYRGSAFWNGANASTDRAVIEVVIQMCLRGGLHLSEWYGFISDRRIRKGDKASKRSKKLVN